TTPTSSLTGPDTASTRKRYTISLHDALPISSQVEYGTTTSYGTTTTLDTTLGTTHTVTLAGLADGTGYHFKVMSKDAANNLATSSDASFTTLDTTAPVISGVAVSAITGSGATISWTTTEAATSQVEYGTTTNYGTTTTLDTTLG